MTTIATGPAEIVTTFLALWAERGGLDRSVRDYFTEATVWENVGLATTTGIEEAIALNAQLAASMGLATIRVENLAVAVTGDKVLTERIDHMVDAAGNTMFSAPVMGIFEIAGGKIAAWRDYFDSAGAAAAMQARLEQDAPEQGGE
jgi:limonene-1,2-epoxide hydrolase